MDKIFFALRPSDPPIHRSALAQWFELRIKWGKQANDARILSNLRVSSVSTTTIIIRTSTVPAGPCISSYQSLFCWALKAAVHLYPMLCISGTKWTGRIPAPSQRTVPRVNFRHMRRAYIWLIYLIRQTRGRTDAVVNTENNTTK